MHPKDRIKKTRLVIASYVMRYIKDYVVYIQEQKYVIRFKDKLRGFSYVLSAETGGSKSCTKQESGTKRPRNHLKINY